MKKTLLFSVAFLMSFAAAAQFETNLTANYYDYFLRTLKGDYVMIVNGKVGIAFDKKGQQFQSLTVGDPVGGYYHAFDLVDTSVVFSVAAFSLDPFGWFGNLLNVKYDKYWQPHGFGDNEYQGSLAEKTTDGGFIMYRTINSNITKKNMLGQGVWSITNDTLSILDIATDTLLRSIAATEQGLWIVNSTGQTDTLFSNYIFTNVETIYFGNLVGAKADTIYMFNSNFEIIQKAPIPGQVVRDMQSMEGKVAVLTASNHVYLYDQNLLPISDFQLNYDHLSFKNIMPDQDGIVLAGNHHYGEYPAGNAAIFIKKFDTDGFDPFEMRDIGLQFIQPSTQIDVWPENGKFRYRFHNVKFQVTNFSDTVLTSFRANVRFPDLPMEWPLVPSPVPQHYFKQFNNVNLAPGQIGNFTWDEFTGTLTEYIAGTNLELCFWSSMPDGKSDINDANDVACADFLVNDEVQLSETRFEVYPNPTSSRCDLLINMGSYQDVVLMVFDAFGRQLQSQPIQSGDNHLKINDLAIGLNLLMLMSEGSIIQSKKVVRN